MPFGDPAPSLCQQPPEQCAQIDGFGGGVVRRCQAREGFENRFDAGGVGRHPLGGDAAELRIFEPARKHLRKAPQTDQRVSDLVRERSGEAPERRGADATHGGGPQGGWGERIRAQVRFVVGFPREELTGEVVLTIGVQSGEDRLFTRVGGERREGAGHLRGVEERCGRIDVFELGAQQDLARLPRFPEREARGVRWAFRNTARVAPARFAPARVGFAGGGADFPHHAVRAFGIRDGALRVARGVLVREPQGFDCEFAAGTRREAPRQDRFELAKVARPRVGLEAGDRIFGQAARRDIVFAAPSLHERTGAVADAGGVFAESWQLHLEPREALGEARVQRPFGDRDETQPCTGDEPGRGPVFDPPRELDLQRRRQSVHLFEAHRGELARRELPALDAPRRKQALAVEIGLAGNRYKGSRRNSGGQLVEVTRQDPAAGAHLAADPHWNSHTPRVGRRE